MAERWAVADLRQTVRVYPNFEHAGKYSVYLARSRQIELQMRLMRLRGTGSDFESLRDYREGDEIRNICWTATARRGKAVAKTFQCRAQPGGLAGSRLRTAHADTQRRLQQTRSCG